MLNGNTELHMRTINEAAEHFKSLDPHTALTKTAVRRLVNSGAVPSVRIGNKALVSLKALEAYLKGEQLPTETENSARGSIRPVEVKV